MKIKAKASKCNLCHKISIPPRQACSCWDMNLNWDRDYVNNMNVIFGFIIADQAGTFLSCNQVKELLREGTEVITEDGQQLIYEMLPED